MKADTLCPPAFPAWGTPPSSVTDRLCAFITTATPRETLRKLIDTMPEDDPDHLHSVTLSVISTGNTFLLPSSPPQPPRTGDPP